MLAAFDAFRVEVFFRTAQRILGSYDTLAPLGHATAELPQKGTVGFDGLAVGGQQNKMSSDEHAAHAKNLTHPLHPLQNPKIYPLPTLSLEGPHAVPLLQAEPSACAL